MIKEVEYFEKPGKSNTDSCVKIVKRAIKEERYDHVILASTSGATAKKFHDALLESGVNLVVVTHSQGFKNPNENEFDPGLRKELEKGGTKILTTTILTHSLETALGAKFQGVLPTHIIAHSLRRFGQGAKVCCEIVMEAADCGMIPEMENVISIAGTGHGSDTICIIKSATSKRFLDLKVSQFLAKPL